jgi:DnaJ-class molecular chaperone
MSRENELYERLGVNRDATMEEIAKAGRKMSMKWHPDKNKNNVEEATRKFNEVRESIDILTNEEKRRNYDQFGTTSSDNEYPPPPDLSNLFNMFGFGHNRNNKQEIEPVECHLNCTLDNIAKEEILWFSYQQKIVCQDCKGEGGKNVKKCEGCRGSGKVSKIMQTGPIQQHFITNCEKCNGNGKKIDEICKTCNGQEFTTILKKESIKLQKGIEDGVRLIVNGKGNQKKNCFPPEYSDLILFIHIEPHEVFRRENEHLFVDMELHLYEALFGFTKLVHHIDGRTLKISYQGKTEYGTSRKMEGEGLFNLKTGKKGNLYLHFVFYLPDLSGDEELMESILNYQKQETDTNIPYIHLKEVEKYEFDKNEEQREQQRQQPENIQEPPCRQM